MLWQGPLLLLAWFCSPTLTEETHEWQVHHRAFALAVLSV